jgi:hypothetical protein
MAAKPKKQTVTFTEAVEVRDHNNEIEQSFKAGQTIALEPASARRWITRGKASYGNGVVEPPADESAGPDETADADPEKG